MPKIEIDERAFYRSLGRTLTEAELADLLPVAKAELDARLPEEGLLKIELNDTNRPDLWSTGGLARQLGVYLGGPIREYGFFSLPGRPAEAGERRVEVEPGLREVRPFFTGFVAVGKPIEDAELRDLIQTQEKLCWNFGNKRATISMGIYRADRMMFPIRYRAVDPDRTAFVPLGMERRLTLRRILSEHPKGIEYGYILKDAPLYPFLEDARGEVLSFPPIINSAHLGAVQVGDSEHLIELTGTYMDTLLLACSIVACDLADAGYRILPLRVIYPYDTPYGREVTTPYYFQQPVTLEAGFADRLLGDRIPPAEAAALVRRMGSRAEAGRDRITLFPPPYRNDFLHPVDVVEEIMIGRGMDSFAPLWPTDFTIGRLSEAEQFQRRAREIMVGLGYQEMIYNYLGPRRDFVERMNATGEDLIEIVNPMTENYEVLRNSQLPNLLASESVSGHAAYPHRMFEIGKVAFKDARENDGSQTRNRLAFLIADQEAGFNDASGHLQALLFYLGREYRLEEVRDPRFIPGRAAAVVCTAAGGPGAGGPAAGGPAAEGGVPGGRSLPAAGGRRVGVLGEVHPEVLENWGIQMPCVAAELDLDALIDLE